MRIFATVTAIAAAGLGLAAAEKSGKLPCCTNASINHTTKQSAPLVCSLTDKSLRERKDELAELFTEAALYVTEIDNGHSVTLRKGFAPQVAEFIELERACCPFFAFTLTFDPEDGPITLTVTGPEGAKEFSSKLFDAIPKKNQ